MDENKGPEEKKSLEDFLAEKGEEALERGKRMLGGLLGAGAKTTARAAGRAAESTLNCLADVAVSKAEEGIDYLRRTLYEPVAEKVKSRTEGVGEGLPPHQRYAAKAVEVVASLGRDLKEAGKELMDIATDEERTVRIGETKYRIGSAYGKRPVTKELAQESRTYVKVIERSLPPDSEPEKSELMRAAVESASTNNDVLEEYVMLVGQSDPKDRELAIKTGRRLELIREHLL